MKKEATRVLIVDDEKSIRDVLTKVLAQRGFAVISAPSGADALRELQSGRFGLMLLDVKMPPGPNGVELLPQALDLDPELPIIMLTGVSDLTTAARCMQLGAREYLTKPIDLQALNGAIDKTLKR
jgi:DNA-binding NtrC family response regulator